ncbi:sensor domain-containing diguanylate cyclase [Novosphingobium album (ex Hu et al. 2023)]|uniref:Diguanylate cyclase n=1 Tax=Novosphingobium album (ex Hu et al. 2023) TaxID=2930093 RepID=A0ABT0B5J8_9SPHN|nr:diguanylate cyclase [Novosphingobium album (ex Hu et al. 2023)]MCJ2180311.1 diguanylate cyclase [Novosphingobium album (ex Hu et al. 2023)]
MLSEFIEAIATSVAVVSINDKKIGCVVSCNQNFCSMLGARTGDVIDRPLREFIPRYARKEFELHLTECIEKSFTLEFIQPFDLDGTTRWWRVIMHPVLDNTKEAASILLTCIDVSEKMVLENDLRAANSRLSSIIQSAYDGIVTIDSNQMIKIFNASAEEMFGYDADEIIGKHISTLIPHRFHERHDEHLKKFNSSPIRSRQMFERGGRITGVTSDGAEFPVEISIAKIDVDGETEYTAVVRDISERARLIDQLQEQATVDALTGLINRRSFHERATEHIALAHRHGNPLSLLMIDIDKFKQINDTFGHAAGDRVLQAMAASGAGCLRKSDFFARLGGEEFAILMPMTDRDEAARVGERMRSTIANAAFEFDWMGQEPIPFTVSIGVDKLQDDEIAIDNALKRADSALYEAKRGGRNCIKVWGADQPGEAGAEQKAA